ASTAIPLAVVGLVPTDDRLLAEHGMTNGSPRFKAWRAGVWTLLGLEPRGLSTGYNDADSHILARLPQRLTGFPVPDAIDGELLATWAEYSYVDQAEAFQLHRSITSAGCSIREGTRRWRKYAIIGIDLSELRGLPPVGVKVDSARDRWLAA